MASRGPVGPDGVSTFAGPELRDVVGGRRGTPAVEPLGRCARPGRPQPRRHHSLAEVRPLLGCAEQEVERASASLAAEPASPRWLRSLFSAEQDLLLVRLAANSGARRGKLAVLRLGDLDGRVLTIERGLSHGVRGSTKSPRRDV